MIYYQELVQHIEKVKDLLTEENWDKNAYYFYSVKCNILCMNIDGVIQTQVNPEVKKIYEQYINKEITAARACARAADTVFADRIAAAVGRRSRVPHTAEHPAKDFSILFDLWVNREDWIKEDRIYDNNINYGNLDLHYLVGLTGLDYKFEQKPKTTLSMIKDKLDETIKLIKKIEKYIIYI